jgi:hypothetical protein
VVHSSVVTVDEPLLLYGSYRHKKLARGSSRS